LPIGAWLAGITFILLTILASINGSDNSISADAPRQTIEVQTPSQAPTAPAATQSPETAAPAPIQESDGATATVTTSPTVKINQTVVDSSTRVTVKPKPVTTPATSTQATTKPESTAPAAPQQKSPTEGYIRPQVTFLGVTACTPSSDGWVMTLSWKVSGGHFVGRFFNQNSGMKTTRDSWIITTREEFGSSDAPQGEMYFDYDGTSIWFMGMNGENQIIDEYMFPGLIAVNASGVCR
jgi:CCR4-NOT transcriptional regulation complex NOT5 subunit